MKLTDELISKIDAAETLEEKKAIIEAAGIELTDEEIEKVAGGAFAIRSKTQYVI